MNLNSHHAKLCKLFFLFLVSSSAHNSNKADFLTALQVAAFLQTFLKNFHRLVWSGIQTRMQVAIQNSHQLAFSLEQGLKNHSSLFNTMHVTFHKLLGFRSKNDKS